MNTILQQNIFLERLSNIGFKEVEAKIFLVLLKGGILSASEITQRTKISRTSVYETLKSFAQKGYCNEIETNTILNYEMIDPQIIADKIEQEIKHNTDNRVKHLKEIFEEILPLYRSEIDEVKSNINVELIRGFNRHREVKFHDIFKQAKKEVFFMIRLEGFISDEIDETAKKFIKNGGIIRSIYEVSSKFKIKVNDQWVTGSTDDLIKVCKAYEDYGEQLRLTNEKILNMTIFDREIVFTNVNDKSIPRHNKSDIIVRNRDYAKGMIDLFESYWNNALTIKDYKKTNKEIIEK